MMQTHAYKLFKDMVLRLGNNCALQVTVGLLPCISKAGVQLFDIRGGCCKLLPQAELAFMSIYSQVQQLLCCICSRLLCSLCLHTDFAKLPLKLFCPCFNCLHLSALTRQVQMIMQMEFL